MQYDSALHFFLNLMKNLDIPVRLFPVSDEKEFKTEMDIYPLVGYNISYPMFMERLLGLCQPNCIYHSYDDLYCHYLVFQLPETEEPSYLLIGPYSRITVSQKEVLEISDRLNLSPNLRLRLENFYVHLKLITDEINLATLVNTLGAELWGDLNNFVWVDLDSENEVIFPFIPDNLTSPEYEYEEPHAVIKRLEENYQAETAFLTAVSTGQAHKAEMYMKNYTLTRIQQRVADPLRNVKNYSIILNTLLRKAAEFGGVHPIHIDRISTLYAQKIELLTHPEAAAKLHQEMVHKYCLLVKNHSLQNYSPIVKKVITNVDADLTADLSLKAQSELLNVNASYLSSLFKKETGQTLTEYVNRNRVLHAVMLLNTTDLQIQFIAQYCGINDVNYFTKIFKKFIGKTPQEYRRNISPA